MFRQIERRVGLVVGAAIYLMMFSLYGITMSKAWIAHEVDVPIQIACSVFMALFVVPDLCADVCSYVSKRRAINVE